MVKKKIGIVFFILGLLLISKVGADVSELDKNLVNLGDFEEKDIKKYAAEKWGIQFDKGVILTEETSHSGRQSLKFRVPDGAKRDYFAINIPLCKVEPGKEYKVTFWAKAVDAVGSYTLFPEYAFYKGAREKPKYVGRVFQVIRNPNFDWRKIERIVAIPKDAEWLKFEIGTKARLGSIYIDDISISSMHMLTKESRKERAYIFNKSINSYFSVDEEFESQQIKWSTPYSKGKTKVLF
jgi:hypothetical protein